MKLKILFVFLVTILLYSCQSVPKDISYLQDINNSYQELVSAESNFSKEPTLKTSDILLITVSTKETTDPQTVAAFNLPLSTFLAPGENTIQASSALKTYTIDNSGYINYPVIGKVKLVGLPFSVAIDTLEKRIAKYIVEPIVNMELLSFKVTVLGEVLKPGTIQVTNNRISILDAIGAAGDMTIYGNRKNIKIYRETNNKKEVATLDLTSSQIFSSPYFYLQQNDVVIVDPNDTKKKDSKYAQGKGYNLTILSTVFGSLITITSLIITIISINNK